MTKGELQAKYPDFKAIKYEPKADCKFCKGDGERSLPGLRFAPCICACVDHSVSTLAGETLGKVARDELAKMKKNRR